MPEIDLTPVSRVEGHLSVRVKVEGDRYVEAKVSGEMFRGFELLLRGKKLAQAPNLVGKICGVCGATHTLVSTEVMEMLMGVYPSWRTVILRNAAYSLADIMYNNVVVTFLFQGLDFSTPLVTEKEYEKARETTCQFKDRHGFSKVSDLMGELYFGREIFRLAMKLQTELRELATAIWLRYPQPLSLKPGSITLRDPGVLEKVRKYMREDSKVERLLYVMAELREFYRGVFRDVGRDFVTYGLLEGEGYDADYSRMREWGDKRYFPPGLVKGGELVTGDLREILLGVEVLKRGGIEELRDPLGEKLSINHPWCIDATVPPKGEFIPKVLQNGISPTTGDIARLYVFSLRKGKPCALEYEWEYRSNDVIERSFARMFTVAMLKEVLENIEDPGGSLDPVKGVKYSMAVGAHDAPRGANAHWVVSKDGTTVSRYGIVTVCPYTIISIILCLFMIECRGLALNHLLTVGGSWDSFEPNGTGLTSLQSLPPFWA